MLDMAEEHGVKYTGVIIDNYEDDVSGDVVEQEDVQRFQYFGNMLLHQGGELGYHGYNHQPLSLSNVDYANILPYKTWESYDAMKKAMTELIRFGKEMFPGTELSVYVPPSNVLSDEGREMIVKEFRRYVQLQVIILSEIWHIHRSLKPQKMELWNSPVLFPVQ